MATQQQKVTIDISSATIVKVVLVLVAVVLLWALWKILAAVFLSFVIASSVDPLVDWLQKRGISRGISAFFIFTLLAAFVVLVLYLLVPPIATQLTELSTQIPAYFEKLSPNVENFKNLVSQVNAIDGLQNILSGLGGQLGRISSGFASFFSSTLTGVVSLLTIVVLSFYLVAEEDGLKKMVKAVSPAKYQGYLADLFSRIQQKLGRWMRGQLFLMFIVGLLVFIGLEVMGVQYALMLGILAGLLEIIPVIGVVVAIIPALFLAFSQNYVLTVFVLVLFVVVQQFENHVLVPRIMQRSIGLNPAVVIVVLLVGAQLGGLLGVIVAMPVAAAVSVFLRDIFDRNSGFESSRGQTVAKQKQKVS